MKMKIATLLVLGIVFLAVVACSSGGGSTYTVGGTVSGLSGGTLVRRNNGADELSITSNGQFTFAEELANNADYSVTIISQPASHTCSLSAATGTIAGSNVGSVAISCRLFKYFNGDNGSNGIELWRSDGTEAGTVMVKDIHPGAGSFYGFNSDPDYLSTFVNGVLFFAAYDGINGYELWKSDGTEAGTIIVKNINPAAGGASFPMFLSNANGTLFFVADDGTNGHELWKSNGSAADTIMLKDVYPGGGNGAYIN